MVYAGHHMIMMLGTFMNAIATVMTINLLGMDQMIGQKALNIMEYLDNGANVTEKNVLET